MELKKLLKANGHTSLNMSPIFNITDPSQLQVHRMYMNTDTNENVRFMHGEGTVATFYNLITGIKFTQDLAVNPMNVRVDNCYKNSSVGGIIHTTYPKPRDRFNGRKCGKF